MFLKLIRIIFFVLFFVSFGQKSDAQIITYTFIDPCTKEVTLFSIPVQSGKTTIIFYGKMGNFDANDVSNGTFANWINQSYSDYRKISPCSQQQGQVTQNQITTQIISNTVQSIVSSIMSSTQSQSQSVNMETGGGSGDNDAGGKSNNDNSNKKKDNGSNNINGTSTGSSSNQTGGQSQSGSGTNNSDGGTNNQQGGGTTTNGGGSTNSGNPTQGGSSTTQSPVGSGNSSSGNNSNSNGSSSTGGSEGGNNTSDNSGNNGGTSDLNSTGSSGSGNSSSDNSGNGTDGTNSNGTGGETNTQNGEEVGATMTMNNDAHNDNGSGGSSSSGGSKSGKSGSGNARSNPIIVSSDVTSAQNLNKSFTPIINVGTSKSSMTGLSSYGVMGMVWLNFKQFALSAKYTKTHYNKNKKLKFVHNVNFTGVYTYGNFLGFVGYSGILNGGKYGITGFNVSGATTIIAKDKSGYYSPSITAFYTRPIKVNKKFILSPEIYVISTPLVYSTKEKVTVSDRYFSGFIGSGFDYQISKRFKVNVNYKANLSTNPQFPILSFFLIGSKVNL
jgi:hypothetical protein